MQRPRASNCCALLREHDVPDGRNIGLISNTVRYALDDGCDVILEGILFTTRYSKMLEALGATTADPLNFANETIIPEAWSISETVERILADLSRYSPRMPDRLDGTYINGH
jgi:hypothetical protein